METDKCIGRENNDTCATQGWNSKILDEIHYLGLGLAEKRNLLSSSQMARRTAIHTSKKRWKIKILQLIRKLGVAVCMRWSLIIRWQIPLNETLLYNQKPDSPKAGILFSGQLCLFCLWIGCRTGYMALWERIVGGWLFYGISTLVGYLMRINFCHFNHFPHHQKINSLSLLALLLWKIFGWVASMVQFIQGFPVKICFAISSDTASDVCSIPTASFLENLHWRSTAFTKKAFLLAITLDFLNLDLISLLSCFFCLISS